MSKLDILFNNLLNNLLHTDAFKLKFGFSGVITVNDKNNSI